LIAGVGFGWTEIGLGDYAAFSAAFGQFTAAIVSLTGVLPAILGLIPLYERAKLILETAPEETSGRDDPGPLQGSIEVQGVTFRYGPGLPVICGTYRSAPIPASSWQCRALRLGQVDSCPPPAGLRAA